MLLFDLSLFWDEGGVIRFALCKSLDTRGVDGVVGGLVLELDGVFGVLNNGLKTRELAGVVGVIIAGVIWEVDGLSKHGLIARELDGVFVKIVLGLGADETSDPTEVGGGNGDSRVVSCTNVVSLAFRKLDEVSQNSHEFFIVGMNPWSLPLRVK